MRPGNCSMKETKTYKLDQLPSITSKHCLSNVVPFITHVLNLSHSEEVVLDSLKQAVIWPLIKNVFLDNIIIKNYKHVSNLSQLSKVIETIVANCLSSHLDSQRLQDEFQSAYRDGHSIETAFLKVCSDIHMAMDRRQGTLLVLLDLSAAFDTFDDQILLYRLFKGCGLPRCDSAVDEIIPSQLCGASGNWPVYISTTRTQGGYESPGALYWAWWSFLCTCNWWVMSLEVVGSAFTIMPMTCNWVSLLSWTQSLCWMPNLPEAFIWEIHQWMTENYLKHQ